MTTIEDNDTRRSAHSPPRAFEPRRRVSARHAANVGIVTLLALLVIWRLTSAGTEARERGATSNRPATAAAAANVGAHHWNGIQVMAPRSWRSLARGRDFATWGTAGRSHTVTLAATEASVLPLAGIVRGVAREAATALPGAAANGEPRAVPLPEDAGRADTAMRADFRIQDAAGRTLYIAQVWRRDVRAGHDLVATWTSIDGRWPVNPSKYPPTPGAAG